MADTDGGGRTQRVFFHYVIPIALAALVSYFTTLMTIQVQIARLEEREALHYQNLTQRHDDLRLDVRWLISQSRGGLNVPDTAVRP